MSYCVVAIDGSESSNDAVRWAARSGHALKLATSYTMPQFLYAEGMVPPQELFDELQQEAQARVDAASALARETRSGVELVEVVAEGSPIDMLLELSKSEETSMICMGSRGLGGLQGMVLGSVSAAVASHAHCPVVVIRQGQIGEDGPIVVGVDGSEVSDKAVEFAFEQAKTRGVPLIAVHTWMDVAVAGLAVAWDDEEAVQRDLLKERLEGIMGRCSDVDVQLQVTRDRPVRALAEAAAQASLLVVGSHGRGGFKGMLLGSTSRALLQHAPCPMVVVRSQEV